MNKLVERAYAQVVEAERLRTQVDDLADSPSAGIIERTFVAQWVNAALEATRLCLLACEILQDQDVIELKHRIEAIEPFLWDNYVEAEWLTWPLWLIQNGLDNDEAERSYS